jgi:transcriptional regulator with XRE-family HTH domain
LSVDLLPARLDHAAMSVAERFGVNLCKARLAAGLSQEELGLRCGLHRTAIYLIEHGKREPKLGTIVKLTGYLDLDPKELYAGIEWNRDQNRLDVTPESLPPTRVRRPPAPRPSR